MHLWIPHATKPWEVHPRTTLHSLMPLALPGAHRLSHGGGLRAPFFFGCGTLLRNLSWVVLWILLLHARPLLEFVPLAAGRRTAPRPQDRSERESFQDGAIVLVFAHQDDDGLFSSLTLFETPPKGMYP
jgi:hypothetical protein